MLLKKRAYGNFIGIESFATIETNKNSPKYRKGPGIKVFFVFRPYLYNEIKISNLDNKNESVILATIKELNPNLDINELGVRDITDTTAVIYVKEDSLKYENSSEVTVKLTVGSSLPDLIKISDLGNLDNKNESVILAAVKELNPNLDINEFGVRDITDTTAVVYVKEDSLNYESNSEVTVKLTVGPSLPDLIKISDLGNLDSNNESVILAAVKELNPNLDINANCM